MKNEDLKICPVCEDKLSPGISSWHFFCNFCKHELSDLDLVVNPDPPTAVLIDETKRELGLKKVRQENFEKLLTKLMYHCDWRGKVLDVGCAHGWFIEVAAANFEVSGIEPDPFFFKEKPNGYLNIRQGFFPESIEENEIFQIIIFNDVFEHLADPNSILRSCRKHIDKQGLIVLNLPSSDGFFYRISKFIAQLGFPSSFDRMWQKGLPSPHLHYYSRDGLRELLQKNDFCPIDEGYLKTLSLKGLYKRIDGVKGGAFLYKLGAYLFLVLAMPFLSILPKDSMFIIARKEDRSK